MENNDDSEYDADNEYYEKMCETYQDAETIIYRPIPRFDFKPICSDDYIQNNPNTNISNVNISDEGYDFEMNLIEKYFTSPSSPKIKVPPNTPSNTPTNLKPSIPKKLPPLQRSPKSENLINIKKQCYKIDTTDFHLEFWDINVIKKYLEDKIIKNGEYYEYSLTKNQLTKVIFKMRDKNKIIDFILNHHIIKI